MVEQNVIMDLTQDSDCNDNCDDDMPPITLMDGCISPKEIPKTATTVQSKGKGKGKRTSVGSMGVQAKKQATTDRLAAKQQQTAEKKAKKAAAEMNKVYKPGECMKYMNIEMHPSLASAWYMSDLAREAGAVGARVSPAPDVCDRGLVMWSRSVQRLQGNAQQQLGLCRREACARAAYVWEAQELQELVAAHTLATTAQQLKDLVGGDLTVIIFGVKEFFKASRRKTANSNRKLMTEIDLEMAITDLLVTAGCDTHVVDTPAELAMLLVQFTKAIAEEPYKKAKRACEEQSVFYMQGNNKNCIGVDNDGNGLARLWQQMIAVLPQSSLEVARAVCGQYKSPLMLREASLSQDSVRILAELGVSRAGAPGARARRLGPDFARKLRALLTEENGDVLIE